MLWRQTITKGMREINKKMLDIGKEEEDKDWAWQDEKRVAEMRDAPWASEAPIAIRTGTAPGIVTAFSLRLHD